MIHVENVWGATDLDKKQSSGPLQITIKTLSPRIMKDEQLFVDWVPSDCSYSTCLLSMKRSWNWNLDGTMSSRWEWTWGLLTTLSQSVLWLLYQHWKDIWRGWNRWEWLCDLLPPDWYSNPLTLLQNPTALYFWMSYHKNKMQMKATFVWVVSGFLHGTPMWLRITSNIQHIQSVMEWTTFPPAFIQELLSELLVSFKM